MIENDKLSKRIEELERYKTLINSLNDNRLDLLDRLIRLEDKNNISSDESHFKLLEMRTENLREDMNRLLELLCEPDSIPGRPSKFQLKRLTVTYDDIQEIHRVLGEHRKHFFKSHNRVPYKCPVCDGKLYVCIACKGEGIVWG